NVFNQGEICLFGHPNKQILTQSEGVLRKTLRAGPFIRLPSLFTFRLERLNFKANASVSK
ncbi:MAG: hypothetical protein ACI9T9_002664, partial [Oleiphilaceae bacterium]